MRQQFILYRDSGLHDDNLGAETEEEVFRLCPWASEVIEADGGWWAFESVKDAEIWRNQA
jgi:hypothetical protein